MATRRSYNRVLVKFSGEALSGEGSTGIHPEAVDRIVDELMPVYRLGVRIALVPGGGNMIRGRMFSGESGIDRVTADHMGMLGTMINGLALKDRLEKADCPVRLMSAVHAPSVCEPYLIHKARHHLDKGRIVILAGGTGSPFFTTDTTAALRAVELRMDAFLKGTKVDGIYTDDPKKNAEARRIPRISYMDALKQRIKVMDATAFSMCMENRLPAVVFNFFEKGNLIRIINGEEIGTFAGGDSDER